MRGQSNEVSKGEKEKAPQSQGCPKTLVSSTLMLINVSNDNNNNNNNINININNNNINTYFWTLISMINVSLKNI